MFLHQFSVLIPVTSSSFSFSSFNAFLFLPNTGKKKNQKTQTFPLQNRTKRFFFPISNFVFFCKCKKKLLKNQYIVVKSHTVGNGASLVNKGNCNVSLSSVGLQCIQGDCPAPPCSWFAPLKMQKLISEMKSKVWKELFLESKFLVS